GLPHLPPRGLDALTLVSPARRPTLLTSRLITRRIGKAAARVGAGLGLVLRYGVWPPYLKLILLPEAGSAPNSPLVARSSGICRFRKQRTHSGPGWGHHHLPTDLACPHPPAPL